MRFDGNGGSAPNYEPNTVAGTPAQSPRHAEPAWALGDAVADRHSHRSEDDHYTQPGDLFRLMSPPQRQLLIDNLAGSLRGVTRPAVVALQLEHFAKVDERLAAGIAAALEAERAGRLRL